MKKTFLITSCLLALLTSCDKDDDNNYQPGVQATVVKASGDLTTALTGFRHLLGDSLNTVPGKTSGRREINWDGVPVDLTSSDNFPFDFFNAVDPAIGNGRKRGLVYTAAGSPFRVDSADFSGIDPSYASQFEAFSGKRTFASRGNHVSGIAFKIAGTNTDASVKGFGAIFSDVDDASSTYMEFFNGDKSLGVYKVPVATGTNSFSFLGVHFPAEKVTSVKITAGNGALAAGVKDISSGGTKDLVVMDDFFYSEPVQ